MSINVATNTLNKHIKENSKKKLSSQLKQIFTDASLKFSKADISFKNVNAEDGGTDKECLINVKLSKLGNITARSKARNLRAAYAIALRKVNRSVRKRKDKFRAMNKSTPSLREQNTY